MKRYGFTLVELLVVISVLGLLLAILMSTLSAVRQQARQTACQAQLRQLGTHLHLYNTENDTLPPGIYSTPYVPESVLRASSVLDIPGVWWFYFIDLVPDWRHPDKGPLICPANKLKSIFKYIALYGNYGVNWSLCRSPTINNMVYGEYYGQPLSLSSLRHPGETLLVADSGYTLIGWTHTLPWDQSNPIWYGYSRPLNYGYIPGANVNLDRVSSSPHPDEDEEDFIEGRHPHKTVNVAFADGHVAAKQADDLVVQPLESEGEFANLSPLWKP